MVLAKNCYFFRFVFSVKVVHKIVFKYVLQRKQASLDCIKISKYSRKTFLAKNCHVFPCFIFGKNCPKNNL